MHQNGNDNDCDLLILRRDPCTHKPTLNRKAYLKLHIAQNAYAFNGQRHYDHSKNVSSSPSPSDRYHNDTNKRQLSPIKDENSNFLSSISSLSDDSSSSDSSTETTVSSNCDSLDSVARIVKQLSYFTMEPIPQPHTKKRSGTFRRLFSGAFFGKDKKKKAQATDTIDSSNFCRQSPLRHTVGSSSPTTDNTNLNYHHNNLNHYNDTRQLEQQYAQMHINRFNQIRQSFAQPTQHNNPSSQHQPTVPPPPKASITDFIPKHDLRSPPDRSHYQNLSPQPVQAPPPTRTTPPAPYLNDTYGTVLDALPPRPPPGAITSGRTCIPSNPRPFRQPPPSLVLRSSPIPHTPINPDRIIATELLRNNSPSLQNSSSSETVLTNALIHHPGGGGSAQGGPSPRTSPQKEDMRKSVEAYYWAQLKKLRQQQDHELYAMHWPTNAQNGQLSCSQVRRSRSLSPHQAQQMARSMSLPRNVAPSIPEHSEPLYRPIFRRGSLSYGPEQRAASLQNGHNKKVSFCSSSAPWPTRNGFTVSPPQRRVTTTTTTTVVRTKQEEAEEPAEDQQGGSVGGVSGGGGVNGLKAITQMTSPISAQSPGYSRRCRRQIFIKDDIYGQFGGYQQTSDIVPEPIYIPRNREVVVRNKVCDIYGRIHDSPSSPPVNSNTGMLMGQLQRGPVVQTLQQQQQLQRQQQQPHQQQLQNNTPFVRNGRYTGSVQGVVLDKGWDRPLPPVPRPPVLRTPAQQYYNYQHHPRPQHQPYQHQQYNRPTHECPEPVYGK